MSVNCENKRGYSVVLCVVYVYRSTYSSIHTYVLCSLIKTRIFHNSENAIMLSQNTAHQAAYNVRLPGFSYGFGPH
jgi:hypothetical protein